MSSVLLILLAMSLFLSIARCCMFQPDRNAQCETFDFPVCHSVPGINFNSTSFPNIFGHRSFEDARRSLTHSFLKPLDDLSCSEYTRIFICASVFPLCYQQLFDRVEPCREMCMAVRESCQIPLQRANLEWPGSLNCNQFAPYGTKLCIWNDSSSCSPSTMNQPSPRPPTQVFGNLETETTPISADVACTGHLTLVNDSEAVFGGLNQCVEPCRGVHFEDDQNRLVVMWVAAISFLSLVVSILVFFTFLLNYKSVHSLEVSVYYITLSYGLLAFTNLLSVAVGDSSIACDDSVHNSFNQSILVVDGLRSPACSFFFSFGYYFTLCTWSWWAVLSLEWGLTTFKRTSVGMEWKVLFHAVAWGVPFVFLSMAIFTRSSAGNPILQTCWVRKQHEVALLLVPLSLTITLCSILAVVTYPRIIVQRNKEFQQIRNGTNPINITTKKASDPALLDRIGTYIVFYLLPMGLLFGTYFYDYWYREAWEKTYLPCARSSTSLQSCNVPKNTRPLIQVYMAQAFASVCMGFLSVFWLLRQRLLLAWRNLCCIICIISDKHCPLLWKSSGTTQSLQHPHVNPPIRMQLQTHTLDSEV